MDTLPLVNNVREVEVVRIFYHTSLLHAVGEGELDVGDELLGWPRGIICEVVVHHACVCASDCGVFNRQQEDLLDGPHHQEPGLVLQLGGDLHVGVDALWHHGQGKYVSKIVIESCGIFRIKRMPLNIF